jgi:hypothetical protein
LSCCAASCSGIHVFHDEFAAAHDATFGAQFIAQLCLELVDIHRQVFVAGNVLRIISMMASSCDQAEGRLQCRLEFCLEPDIDDFVVPAAGDFPGGLALAAGCS